MRNARIGLRATALAVTIGVSFTMYQVGMFESSETATRVGSAGLAVDDSTARVVERVSYRQDVVRVGDVIVVDGEPTEAITDPGIATMWQIVESVWPASHRDDLRQLSVIEEESRGLVGVVHPAAGGGWILSLDLADVDDPELVVETIVHELSHVVTLDAGVFTFGDDDCRGTRMELGCAAEGTVLAEFADRFWPGGEGSNSLDEHVDEYAMSAAHEDLAETFTAWVLDWPVNGTVIDAKIATLAADPELAALAVDLKDLLD